MKNNFNYLKNIINDTSLIKENIDGFYYPQKVIDIINNVQVKYFLNEYYNLTTADILTMVNDASTLQEVKENLLSVYKEEYANAWYENFIEVLSKIEVKTKWKNHIKLN